MIQIIRREQFEKAADRLMKEPQAIRIHEPNLYVVTNKRKGHAYSVRISRINDRTFIKCGCEAGTPHHAPYIPVVCKHVAAVVIYLRGLRAMRRAA